MAGIAVVAAVVVSVAEMLVELAAAVVLGTAVVLSMAVGAVDRLLRVVAVAAAEVACPTC